MLALAYPHIDVTSDGVPYLTGTRTKVIEVVLDRLAYHWDAEEIQRQHPYLSLGQIHSALAYYYDHQEEMDRALEEQLQQGAAIKARLGESPLRHKLNLLSRLP
ncbi:MAG: DUF433 domain-containing protein [Candidatus Competibacteraceae bacterium]